MVRLIGSRVLFRTVMVALAVLYGFPMIWMVLSSFKSNRETFSDPLALPSSIDSACGPTCGGSATSGATR